MQSADPIEVTSPTRASLRHPATAMAGTANFRRWLLALSTVALILCGTAQAATKPVISDLDYQSKPLYDDQSTIAVLFRTSRPARPGYEYGIVLTVGGKYADPGCSSVVFSWDRESGGSSHIRSAGKHSKILRGTSYWCRGSAYLAVVEHKIGASAIGRSLGDSAEIFFRVVTAP